MSFALVFPGQGSQRSGMGRAIFARSPAAREVFARASEALGWDAAAACFADGPDALALTSVTQPALFTAEAAALAALREAGAGDPACAAGHSLGEYTALHAAGALTVEAGARLTAARGRLMQEASTARPGAMAAVLGATRVEVAAALARAGLEATLCLANYNAPDQTVVSGAAGAIDALQAAAKDLGLRKVVRLATAGAFHSPLMAAAAAAFQAVLDGAVIGEPAFPVVTNAGATPVRTAAQIRAALALQMTAPVRWEESVRAMAAAGVTAFIELGPGDVLSRLSRRIAPDAAAVSVGAPEDLAAALALCRN